jgi:hypothetical protein
LSLPNIALHEQHHRARSSIHQEADHGEPRFPFGRESVSNDRGLRGDACNSKRADPLGREGRSCRSTSVHPFHFRHRGVALSQNYTLPTPLSSPSRYLQQNHLASLKNRQRAEELADQGRGFRNSLEWAAVWYLEAFRYLKGGSRVISLAHYSVEKPFVLAVPHRFLIGEPEQITAPIAPRPVPRQRRPRGCPF